MAYEVRLKPSAQRALRKLPREIQRRIARRLDNLADDTRPAGCERLAGAEGLYRVRAGDCRIVYEVDDDAIVVLVVAIGDRSDVYRAL
ncbi:MAG: type II toxin-antitoxin system RelE family toxin [Acidobacteriota bacterium]